MTLNFFTHKNNKNDICITIFSIIFGTTTFFIFWDKNNRGRGGDKIKTKYEYNKNELF